MKVYVVTAGDYSAYHIEKIFTDRDQAQMYANLDGDRYVEEYPVDDAVLDDAQKLRMNVVYDFEKDFIISIAQVDSEWLEYDPKISDDYYTTFRFSMLVAGKLFREIALDGKRSDMLRKIARDKFYAEVEKLGTTRRILIEQKREEKQKLDRRFNRYTMYTTTVDTGNPFEQVATQEVKDKLDEMYKNGEPMPDVMTLMKMIRESRKKNETEGEKNGKVY